MAYAERCQSFSGTVDFLVERFPGVAGFCVREYGGFPVGELFGIVLQLSADGDIH
jgi:hypothetical protein